MTTAQQAIADRVRYVFRDHEVVKLPLTGPDNMQTPHYGLFLKHKDELSVLQGAAAVKATYHPHTTDDVVALTEAAAYGFDCPVDDLQIDATWGGKGHRVRVQPTVNRRAIVHGRDSIWPTLIVRSDYGGSGFKATVGMKRDACANLQMMRWVDKSHLSIAHRQNFRSVFDDTVERFRQLSEQFDSVLEACKHLHSKKVETKEYLGELFKRSAQTKALDNKIAAILNRIERERYELGTSGPMRTCTLWELVNGVTGYVQHDTPAAKRYAKSDPLLGEFKAFDNANSQAAFDLAFKMAV